MSRTIIKITTASASAPVMTTKIKRNKAQTTTAKTTSTVRATSNIIHKSHNPHQEFYEHRIKKKSHKKIQIKKADKGKMLHLVVNRER